MSRAPLIDVQDLHVRFGAQAVPTLKGISFQLHQGECLALVGESGSGKSVTSLTLMGLHARTSQAQVTGQAWFVQRDGRKVDLLAMPEAEKRTLRGNELAMIFQEPMTSLNPVLTVGEQIAESARLHLKMDRSAALAHARRMLELVEIPAAAQRVHEYPHQLSGGMRQRVMIALAMACNPTLLIADEPTTALDVTIQAQILDLLDRLKSQMGMSILLITHAMGVVAETCQRVVVMYAGRVVEEASVEDLFGTPAHPYTQGLIRSIPRLDLDSAHKQRLHAIPGSVPKLILPPPGCRFAPRCPHANARCASEMPELRELTPGHRVACHFAT
mgnify:CR=1 FL=1